MPSLQKVRVFCNGKGKIPTDEWQDLLSDLVGMANEIVLSNNNARVIFFARAGCLLEREKSA